MTLAGGGGAGGGGAGAGGAGAGGGPRSSALIFLAAVLCIGFGLGFTMPFLFDAASHRGIDLSRLRIERLVTALDRFRLDAGRYPATEEGLVALARAPEGLEGWAGPYLAEDELPRDPWGRCYAYRAPGRDGSAYDLFSRGADGREGGTGNDADIPVAETIRGPADRKSLTSP